MTWGTKKASTFQTCLSPLNTYGYDSHVTEVTVQIPFFDISAPKIVPQGKSMRPSALGDGVSRCKPNMGE